MGVRRAFTGLARDLSRVSKNFFKGFWSGALKLSYCAIFLIAAFVVPHVIWPKMDVKTNTVNTDAVGGQLTVIYIELENSSYLNLKDPDIACEMKGSSGTTIKKASKTIYEALPAGTKRIFTMVEMGTIPEQATKFTCYLGSISVEWGVT